MHRKLALSLQTGRQSVDQRPPTADVGRLHRKELEGSPLNTKSSPIWSLPKISTKTNAVTLISTGIVVHGL